MTAVHVVELLPDWMNGALAPHVSAEVLDHLDTCPECNAAFAAYEEILGALALTLAPVAPDPSVRARILDTASSGRLHRFSGLVSALFACGDTEARAALDLIDDAEGWSPSPFPGITQKLIEGAPPNHLMGFIRLPAGVFLPWHEHLGAERTLVLQGRLLDNDGRVWAPGEEMPGTKGSRHTFGTHGPVACVCGVLLEGGYLVL
ncbi:MAG: cupin domain-containing protein [Pseudomonadota bacterium]|nr:cupin domain-containing protein [Pseudomonadota bacterium]